MRETPFSAPKRLLFICTGNYYRSRFAEAVFNHIACRDGLDWRAFSRGLEIHRAPDSPLSEHALEALVKRGIDPGLTAPNKMKLGLDDLLAADAIVALQESEHRPMFAGQFPSWADKVTYWDIADTDKLSPEEAMPALERKVADLAASLAR